MNDDVDFSTLDDGEWFTEHGVLYRKTGKTRAYAYEYDQVNSVWTQPAPIHSNFQGWDRVTPVKIGIKIL